MLIIGKTLACMLYFVIRYFLLTESAVITGKYQTEVLAVLTEPVGRGPYIKDRGLMFFRNDQADEVNKKFIICPVATAFFSW